MIEIHPVRVGTKVSLHILIKGTIVGMITLDKADWEEVKKASDRTFLLKTVKEVLNLLPVELDSEGYCPYCRTHSEESHMSSCEQQPLLLARGKLLRVLNRLQTKVVEVKGEGE